MSWWDADSAQEETDPFVARAAEAVTLSMVLKPTQAPVWPEDEARERKTGEVPAANASVDELVAIMRSIDAGLPDRLQACRFVWPAGPRGFDHYAFAVDTSFDAPDDLSLRRMRLALALSTVDRSRPPSNSTAGRAAVDHASMPVGLFLMPDDSWTERQIHLGEAKLDFYNALRMVVPWLPADAASLRLDASLGWTTVRPRIECSGQGRHECSWRVADERIGNKFTAYVIAQVPAHARLAVDARLHVELRKRFAPGLRTAYVKEVAPRRYVMDENPSSNVEPVSLRSDPAAVVQDMRHGLEDLRDRGLISETTFAMKLDKLAGQIDRAVARGPEVMIRGDEVHLRGYGSFDRP